MAKAAFWTKAQSLVLFIKALVNEYPRGASDSPYKNQDIKPTNLITLMLFYYV